MNFLRLASGSGLAVLPRSIDVLERRRESGGYRHRPTSVPKLACKPRSVRQAPISGLARRSSLSARRCRHALAAYPRLGGSSRSAPHGEPCSSPLFGLAPDGGCLAADIAAGAGGLLHHRFTLAAQARHCASLWPFSGRSPRPGGCPASCSQERGLSSNVCPQPGDTCPRRQQPSRSPGQLGHTLQCKRCNAVGQGIPEDDSRAGLSGGRPARYRP